MSARKSLAFFEHALVLPGCRLREIYLRTLQRVKRPTLIEDALESQEMRVQTLTYMFSSTQSIAHDAD